MAEVIKMPKMSDTMTEGVIVAWLKKVGDQVKSGDILAEVETDKATMEMESYNDGVLLHIGVQEGQAVPVDAIIAVIGKQGEDISGLLNEATAAPKASEAETKETVTPPDQAAEPTQNAPAGTSTQSAPQTSAQPQQQQPQPQSQSQQQSGDNRLKASPLAKKIAEEKGIELQQLTGSGDQGRIVRKDIENYISSGEKMPQGAAAQQQAQMPEFVAPGQEGFEDVNVSQMRKTIARRLGESKFGAPHFYLTIEINMDRAIEARKTINDFLGSKISYNDMVIKAVAAALKKHPKVNGSWLGDKLRYYQHVHIGVAIAVEDGLVVPVVKHADAKPMSIISQEVRAFADKAKSKKLQPTDFEGNTFTISNLGMFGIEEFTAIINPPDACIMAVGAITEKPVVKNGEITIGNVMKVTLSCDHRIVDGATGAQFLQTFKQYIEEPVTILA